MPSVSLYISRVCTDLILMILSAGRNLLSMECMCIRLCTHLNNLVCMAVLIGVYALKNFNSNHKPSFNISQLTHVAPNLECAPHLQKNCIIQLLLSRIFRKECMHDFHLSDVLGLHGFRVTWRSLFCQLCKQEYSRTVHILPTAQCIADLANKLATTIQAPTAPMVWTDHNICKFSYCLQEHIVMNSDRPWKWRLEWLLDINLQIPLLKTIPSRAKAHARRTIKHFESKGAVNVLTDKRTDGWTDGQV